MQASGQLEHLLRSGARFRQVPYQQYGDQDCGAPIGPALGSTGCGRKPPAGR